MTLNKVYTAAGQLEAEMIKAFLESQGIQVILNQESVGRTIGLSAGTLGQVDVLVPEEQLIPAKALLADLAAGKYETLEEQDFSEFRDDDSVDFEDRD
jgi:hypothetical protein